ncbi:hypothetical protein [Ruania zhangjianzhongii]|uniref:hypothetical protein n=1 Tax=Ruania zhangjianzhongii TaxID=2603206 RepID=UPI0011CC293D|nr:hypothetical protein [Ruania zhangjianzhongii]
MKKSITAALATTALIAGGAAFGTLGAAPANADLVTHCVGTAGEVTVPGDLVVPADATCDLTGTTVTGDVRVRQGGNLIGEGVSIDGQVVGAADSYVDLLDSTVTGDLRMNNAYGAVVEGSAIDGRVTSRAGEEAPVGFLFAIEAELGENLTARAGEVYVENSVVAGTVNSRETVYTDIYDTFIDGRLVVGENAEGSMLCAVVVQGNSRITGNAGPVQVGSDGPAADCDGASYWGGNVQVDANTAGVVIDENIVNGTLRLADNTPTAQVGENNQVRGGINGPHEPIPAEEEQLQAFSAQAEADHADTIQNRIDERRAAAQQQVAEAGSANIG